MIKKLCLAFFVVIFYDCYSIENPNSAIQFNKSFYCNGDTAWFKVWIPESLIAEKAIAKVRIEHSNGKKVLDEFSLLINSNGRGDGYIAIPNSTPSGSYIFWLVLYEKDTYETLLNLTHEVAIINDAEKDLSVSFSDGGSRKDLQSNNLISIKTNSAVYQPREEIQLDIHITDSVKVSVPSHLSIAVREYESCPIFRDISFCYIEKISGKAIDQILINDKVSDRELDQEIRNSNLLVFLVENGRVIQGTTNENGSFKVLMDLFTGNKTIQYWDYFGREIEWDSGYSVNYDLYEKEISVCNSNELQDYLVRNALRKKINYIFNIPRHPSTNVSQQDWQVEPDFVVESSNYEPFRNLKEFMETVITPLKIVSVKDGLAAKMVNPQHKPYFSKEPVFLIDQVISTFKEVLDLDMYNIKSIEFYNKTETLKRFGMMGENGIVAFNTNKLQANRYEKQLKVVHGLQDSVNYLKFINIKVNERQPLFGSCIYWNPNLTTDENGALRVSFFHNDEPGHYKIRILGKLENGDFVLGETTYLVTI